MPVNTFNPNQPWGTAEAHQREHPAMWTPDLIEATNNWVPSSRNRAGPGGDRGGPAVVVHRTLP